MFRIWCVLHQVDLGCQKGYQILDDGAWHTATTSVVGHLRRQHNLISVMGTTCPKLVTTRWLTMDRLVKWIYK